MQVSEKFKQKYSDKSRLINVPCPLCNGFNDSVLATVGYPGIPVRNVICKTCGLIRINPRLSDKEYVEFYEQDFFEYLDPYGRPHYVNTIEKTTDPNFVTEPEKHLLPFILPFVKEGGKVFDVGAGFGQLLYLLRRKKNIIPFGIEPDPGSRNLAKEKMGIELTPETIEEYAKRNTEKFDYIHLEQVFEHLLSPLQALRDLANMLTPDGKIYIGVPGQYNYGVAADRFFELAHTYGYTPAVLKKFADMAGLKIIAIKDPLASNLEMIMVRKEAAESEVSHDQLKFGEKWYVTKWRMLSKIKYLEIRGFVKRMLVSIFGENLKNKIKILIRV